MKVVAFGYPALATVVMLSLQQIGFRLQEGGWCFILDTNYSNVLKANPPKAFYVIYVFFYFPNGDIDFFWSMLMWIIMWEILKVKSNVMHSVSNCYITAIDLLNS
jgi:hypothetical protein